MAISKIQSESINLTDSFGFTGHVIQSVTATSGFTNQTINSATKVHLTNMTVTITPKFSNSKMLVFGYIVGSWTYVSGIAIYKNDVTLISGNTGTTQTGGSVNLWTRYIGASSSTVSNCVPYPFMYQDTVSNTNSTTYKMFANAGWDGGTNNFYFNNRGSSADMLSQSWMCVQEVVA